MESWRHQRWHFCATPLGGKRHTLFAANVTPRPIADIQSKLLLFIVYLKIIWLVAMVPEAKSSK